MSDDQLDLFAAAPPRPALQTCPTCHGAGEIDPVRVAEMLDRPGKTNGAKTSRVAGTTPRKGTQRHAVLRVLARTELSGLTAYEISVALGKSPNQIATRLGELRDDTFVEYVRDSETRAILERETTDGNTGMVQRITPAGRQALAIVETAR